MKIVYASATCSATTSDGLPVRMQAGEPWDGDDPFVAEHPDLFIETPGFPYPRRTVAEPTVEQATAAPGERRNVRRG